MAAPYNLRQALRPEEKQQIVRMMQEAGPVRYHGHIISEDDYHRKLAAYSAYKDVQADQGVPDDDFPDNDILEEDRLTEEIFNAMLDTQDAVDAEVEAKPRRTRKPKGKIATAAPRQANDPQVPVMKDSAPMSRIKRLTGIELELKAKEILYDIRDTQRGRAAMATWAAELPEQEDFPSFKARFDAVVRSLKKYKTCTRSLLDPSYSKRLAAFPGYEERRKRVNADGNEKKQKRLAQQMDVEAAQYAQARERMRAPQGSTNEENEEDQVEEEDAMAETVASGQGQEEGETPAGQSRATRQDKGKGRMPTLMELAAAESSAASSAGRPINMPETATEEQEQSMRAEASENEAEDDGSGSPAYELDYY